VGGSGLGAGSGIEADRAPRNAWDLMRDSDGTVANVSGEMEGLRVAFAEVGAG
jgi:hypothetical protein